MSQNNIRIGTVTIAQAEPVPARPWWKPRGWWAPRITPEGALFHFRFRCTVPGCTTSGWSGGPTVEGAKELAVNIANWHRGKHDQA